MNHPSVSPEIFLKMGQDVLAQQAFSRLLKAQLVEFSSGQCTLEVPITEEVLQQDGFAHGGVISYCADNALTFAGGSALLQPVLTSGFRIDYVRPAKGDKLIAKAQAISVGKRQAVCRCDVFIRQGDEEKLCAVAQGTISVVSKE